MDNIMKVKAAAIFPFIEEILEQGQNSRITVTGSSMYPFLRDGVDSVEFSKGSFDSISRGDIVLIRRRDGAYVMHRVLKKEGISFYMVGDAQQWIEGPLYADQLLAVVTAVYRKDRKIVCRSIWWRTLSGIWLWMLPCRHIVFKLYRGFRRLAPKKRRSS